MTANGETRGGRGAGGGGAGCVTEGRGGGGGTEARDTNVTIAAAAGRVSLGTRMCSGGSRFSTTGSGLSAGTGFTAFTCFTRGSLLRAGTGFTAFTTFTGLELGFLEALVVFFAAGRVDDGLFATEGPRRDDFCARASVVRAAERAVD